MISRSSLELRLGTVPNEIRKEIRRVIHRKRDCVILINCVPYKSSKGFKRDL
jgi:hypothetical protein